MAPTRLMGAPLSARSSPDSRDLRGREAIGNKSGSPFAAKVIRFYAPYGFSGSPAIWRAYSCGTAPGFDRTCPRTKRLLVGTP
jgi:hypothetical protein